MHDHDRALIDGEPAEHPADPIPLGDRKGEVDDSVLSWIGVDMDFDQTPAPRPLREPVTRPNDETMEPCFPRVRIAEGAHMPPGLHERFLDGVLGEVVVAKHEVGNTVRATGGSPHQDGERLVVARLRSLNELPLHVAT